MSATVVLWMQNVKSQTCSPAAKRLRTASGFSDPSQQEYIAEMEAPIAAWRCSERLSFKDILMRAHPAAEFEWRRRLEAEVLKGRRNR